MTTKEIVTLQFGNYSNYIGTNWWNIQESGFVYDPSGGAPPSDINHDVFFREGLTFKGNVTFTPRLLLVDLKGCLKHTDLCVPDEAPVVEESEWAPGVVSMGHGAVEQAIQKNSNEPAQAVGQTGSQSNWTDYVHARYHSRTVNVINEYQHAAAETAPFDTFTLGRSLWRREQFEEDFTDKIRNYVEECDNFQGFQVLLDCVDAFSGLSASCVEYLKDEYSSKSMVAFPVFPFRTVSASSRSDASVKMGIRLLNLALCFDSLAASSSLFVPLSTGSKEFRHEGPNRTFYHTEYDATLPLHSSAILASALDTFTLKYRTKNSEYSLADLSADLNSYGRKASAASLCFPFSVNRGDTVIDALDKWQGPLSKSITPNCELDTDKMMQLYTLRGIPESRLKLPSGKAGKQLDMPAYKCNTVKEMLGYYVACTSYASATDVTVVHDPLPTKLPYPKLFDSNVDRLGNIDTFLTAAADVESVPLLAGLHNGKCVGDMLQVLIDDVKRINFKRFHQYHGEGIDQEEFGECLNRMMSLRECYEDNYEY